MLIDHNINLPELIKQKLNNHIKIIHFFLKDESYLHAKHNEIARQGNTHFYLKLVSDDFKDLSLLQRHQKINIILREEYQIIYSLRIKALSSEEYQCMRQEKMPQ